MGKTGPTPRPGRDTGRRVAGPQPQHDRVELPEAFQEWNEGTCQAYQSYVDSEAAGLLREEDIPAVLRLFDRIDLLETMWNQVPAEPETAERALRSVRLLDAMIARQCAELGIGPLARARLGLGGQPAVKSKLDTFLEDGDGD